VVWNSVQREAICGYVVVGTVDRNALTGGCKPPSLREAQVGARSLPARQTCARAILKGSNNRHMIADAKPFVRVSYEEVAYNWKLIGAGK
jgi:hypothetical protein